MCISVNVCFYLPLLTAVGFWLYVGGKVLYVAEVCANQSHRLSVLHRSAEELLLC